MRGVQGHDGGYPCPFSLTPQPFRLQVMAYEACRDVMEALRSKYSGPLQVRPLQYKWIAFVKSCVRHRCAGCVWRWPTTLPLPPCHEPWTALW